MKFGVHAQVSCLVNRKVVRDRLVIWDYCKVSSHLLSGLQFVGSTCYICQASHYKGVADPSGAACSRCNCASGEGNCGECVLKHFGDVLLFLYKNLSCDKHCFLLFGKLFIGSSCDGCQSCVYSNSVALCATNYPLLSSEKLLSSDNCSHLPCKTHIINSCNGFQ